MSESNILRDYASDHMPQAIASIVLEADTFLQSIQIDKHLHEVETAISVSDDAPIEVTRDRILDGIIYTLEAEISEYSIGFEQYDISVMRKTLEALHNLPQHNNPHDLIELIDDTGSGEERWCDLMGFYYDQDPTDFLPYYQYVNPSLLEKLSEALNERIRMSPDNAVTDAEQLEQDIEKGDGRDPHETLKLFMVKENPPRFRKLLDQGYKFGYSIQHYLDKVLDDQAQPKSEIADEYLASALASGQDVMEAIENADQYLEEYIDDPALIADVIQSMRRHLETLT